MKTSSVRDHLLSNFLENLYERVSDISDSSFTESVIPLLYSIRQQAFDRQNDEMVESLLNPINSIFLKAVRNHTSYNPRIATQVLYIKELSGLSALLSMRIEKEQNSSMQNSWLYFYQPVIVRSIHKATEAIYNLIIYSYRLNLEELRRYLSHNVSDLIRFLDSVNTWDKVQESSKKEMFDFLAKELLYISIFMFQRYYFENRFSGLMTKDIGLPMADHCYASQWNFAFDFEEKLDMLFFNPLFLGDPPFRYYEDPDIISRATGHGYTYDFTFFWIAFGLYRRRRGHNFIPSKFIEQQGSEDLIKHLLNVFGLLNLRSLSEITGIPQEELNVYLKNYREHLSKMISSKKNR